MPSKAPRIGDVVKPRVATESIAGYVIAKEGIHVWVRFFDTAALGESWDVYTRRDNLEVLSYANLR